jgi:hypothetical protein
MFDEGNGDYTKERHEWLPENLCDIKCSLLERQKKRKTKKQYCNRFSVLSTAV